MKNITFIISSVLITYSLTAFAYANWSTKLEKQPCCKSSITETQPPNFSFDVDSRFNTTVTKEQLTNATSVLDIVPENSNWRKFDFEKVNVRLLPGESNNYVNGTSKDLSNDQIKLLNTVDYSTDFVIDAYIKSENPSPKDHHPYYISVVPEKEASYMGRKLAIINYLESNCASTIAKTHRGNLKPGKARFTISTAGTIKNVNLESTSGYPTVDKKMIGLLTTIPGIWVPATNEA